MPETDENRKLQKITKLLEKGGTMLATSHDCGAPMFRYQGKILCPVCDIQEAEQETKKGELEALRKPSVQKEIALPPTKPVVGYDNIALITRRTVQSIAATLESETDLQRIKSKLECIELGIKILKLLES